MDQNRSEINPKVSVVIPVYNTEAYLEEAVRSIMNQTLKEIEIIIIDDGSTDTSLSLIKRLAVEDQRITWSSQSNMGQSVARNVGIERAKGDYIYFMDSDDFLEEDALRSCLQMADQDHVDFLLFNADFLVEQSDRNVQIDYKKPVLDEGVIYSGHSILAELIEQRAYRCSPCMHFIRLNHIKSIPLYFYPGIIHEDELFSALLYMNSQRVAYLPVVYFKRRLRPNSVMTSSYSLKNVNSYLVVGEQLLLFSRNLKGNGAKLVYRLISYILDPNIYRANILPFRERREIFRSCIVSRLTRFISVKTCLVLLFPLSIQLKGYVTRLVGR